MQFQAVFTKIGETVPTPVRTDTGPGGQHHYEMGIIIALVVVIVIILIALAFRNEKEEISSPFFLFLKKYKFH
jgi:hypothetical protein